MERYRVVWWAILIAIWVAVGVGYYYYFWPRSQPSAPQQQPELPRAEAPPPVAESEPQIRHPIENSQQAKEQTAAGTKESQLPALDESDPALQGSITGLIGQKSFEAFVNNIGIVRRVVATIDNLPRDKVPQRMWPAKPTAGRFVTGQQGGEIHLSTENYRRYAAFVRLVEGVDTKKLVALYITYYPLFQQAYRDLGYPKGYFNDRLVEVIDHLNATPDVSGPVKLTRPWVMYQFADPDLEARSFGQKILIRMGSENAAKIKAKLREIRQQVTSGSVSG